MLGERDLARIVDLTCALPGDDINRLAVAVAAGVSQVGAFRADAGSERLRTACTELLGLLTSGIGPAELAAALLGAARGTQRQQQAQTLEVVWTGPSSTVTTSRLTAAVIAGVLADAQREILLIGYAVHTQPMVSGALDKAAQRGVKITLVLERQADNHAFSGIGNPFPTLPARRLAWPGDRRPEGAALHAKVLVVDRDLALVGSANVTGAALERNLECGLLVRGGPQPRAICDHVEALVASGQLRPAHQ